MEVSRAIEFTKIEEIKILSDVRLINHRMYKTISSIENLHVQFSISGELKGTITCHLCLDKHELAPSDKNYIFPLFAEAMNILIGKQISQDQNLKNFKALFLSPPKLSMIGQKIDTDIKSGLQLYDLELEGFTFNVIIEYNVEAIS